MFGVSWWRQKKTEIIMIVATKVFWNIAKKNTPSGSLLLKHCKKKLPRALTATRFRDNPDNSGWSNPPIVLIDEKPAPHRFKKIQCSPKIFQKITSKIIKILWLISRWFRFGFCFSAIIFWIKKKLRNAACKNIRSKRQYCFYVPNATKYFRNNLHNSRRSNPLSIFNLWKTSTPQIQTNQNILQKSLKLSNLLKIL